MRITTFRRPTRATLTTGVICAAALTLGASANAQISALYAGGSPASAGVTIASSGSGVLTPDTSHIYSGGGSLKLVTQGLYQGGTITLNKAYDLGSVLNNKSAYLQIAFQLPSTTNGAGGGELSGPMGGGPTGPKGGAPGSGGNSAGSAYGGLNGGRNSSSKAKFNKAHSMENLRIVLVTTTGRAIEKRIPVSYANDETGWKVVSVPITAIGGLTAGDASIKELHLYGDTSTTLYIGKIGVVIDSTQIMIEPIEEKTVTVNSTYRYNASAHGGATPLVYSWDWDDRDGIQNEAEGRSAVHMYRKSGDYKVTVTVSDPYGVKAPAVTKFNIHIP